MIRYVLFLVLLVGLGGPAAANTIYCSGRAELIEELRSDHNEVPIWTGVDAAGWQLVLTVDPAGTGYSVLLVQPNQLACMLAAGVSWAAMEPQPAEPEQ